MQKRNSGFTLLELLTVVTIAGLLLAVAVPGMRAFIQNAEMTRAANDFVHAVQTARTEAIKRRRNVVVCTAADPLEANRPATRTSSTLNGWIVFVDSNSSGDRDAAGFDDADEDGHQDIDEDANDNGILDGGEDRRR